MEAEYTEHKYPIDWFGGTSTTTILNYFWSLLERCKYSTLCTDWFAVIYAHFRQIFKIAPLLCSVKRKLVLYIYLIQPWIVGANAFTGMAATFLIKFL